MPYYLKHPEHGTHICYTPEDVEAHKAIGWVQFDVEVTPKVAAWLDVLIEPKKRGRKPKAKE